MMNMGFWLVLALFIDQASKLWVEHHVMVGQQLPVIDGIFKITHVKNSGIAFGLFQGHGDTLRLVVLAIAIFVFFIGLRYARKSYLLGFAFGSIVGGALGNLLDRFLRDGWVIDFLSFCNFAISTFPIHSSLRGVGLGFYTIFYEKKVAKPMLEMEKSPENVALQLRQYLERNVSWSTDLPRFATLLTGWFALQKIPYQLHLYDASLPEVSRGSPVTNRTPGTNAFVDIIPATDSEPEENTRFLEKVAVAPFSEGVEGEILFVVKKDKRNRKKISDRPLKFSLMGFSELKPMTENPDYLPISMMLNSSDIPLALTKEEKIVGKLDAFRIIISRAENQERASSIASPQRQRDTLLPCSEVVTRARSCFQEDTETGGIRGMGLTLHQALTEELPPTEIPGY